MAYSAKPAVVRVNAYATAQFQYPRTVLKEISSEVDLQPANEPPQSEQTVMLDTGAGGSGSGFIINPNGYLITSGHLVAATRNTASINGQLLRNGAIAALVRHYPVDLLRAYYRRGQLERLIGKLTSRGALSRVVLRNEVELSNGEKRNFQIIDYSPSLSQKGTDLAILKIERTNLPVVPLGDSDQVHLGDPIWAIGYPSVASSNDDVIGGWLSRDTDLEATLNDGTITSIKRNITNAPVFQTNVAIYHGNSGGPVVNSQGQVIGVSTWGHTNAEQIRFLVPINVARQMLESSRVRLNERGEFDRHYRRALEAAGDGDWLATKKHLAPAAMLFPNSPDLIRFNSDADRAIRSLPLWDKFPKATLAAGTAMLTLILLALLIGYRGHQKVTIPSGGPERYVAPASREEEVLAAHTESIQMVSERILGKFTVLNGSRAGEKLGLGGSGIRIGRESTVCEIVFENPKVSRLHAEIVSLDGKVLLIDRNSSNGTYVNDEKIERKVLRNGDIIYFGGRNAVAVAFHA